MLHADCVIGAESSAESLGAQVDRARVRGTFRAHGDDLSADELDVFVFAEDARTDHVVVVLAGEVAQLATHGAIVAARLA